jgi:hypothetical protein
MGYYQGAVKGDFYAGTRGDPGFFSFLGKVAKGALGLATGLMPGGSAIQKVMTRVPAIGKVGGIVTRAGGVLAKHPVLTAAGAAGAGMAMGGVGRHPAAAGMAHPGVAGMRRRRRMRVTNVKALRRSIRRCQGFAKLATRVLHFTSPRRHVGRPVFKRRTRKRVV